MTEKQRIDVEFHGGILDGWRGPVKAFMPPGGFPLVEIMTGAYKYVYQSRTCETTDDGVFVCDFVQYIGRNESCLD